MHDDPVADFGPEGPLARQLPHYRPREGQLQMAADVADALWKRWARATRRALLPARHTGGA